VELAPIFVQCWGFVSALVESWNSAIRSLVNLVNIPLPSLLVRVFVENGHMTHTAFCVSCHRNSKLFRQIEAGYEIKLLLLLLCLYSECWLGASMFPWELQILLHPHETVQNLFQPVSYIYGLLYKANAEKSCPRADCIS